jgi:hypothetical protein
VAADLRALGARYALAEALSQSLSFRGFGRLPEDLRWEDGLVAVLEARRYRPTLLVVRGDRGSWWFVGVQPGPPPAQGPCWHWPFLCALASREKIAHAQQEITARRSR